MIQVTDWKKVKRFQGRAFTIVDEYTLKFVTLNFQKTIEWSELVSPSSPFFLWLHLVRAQSENEKQKNLTRKRDDISAPYKSCQS